MPRKPRRVSPSGVYHLVIRSSEEVKLFRKTDDFEFYLELLRRMKQSYRFSIYHYCLLFDEIHMLVHVEELAELTKMIQRLHLNYVQYYHEAYGKQEESLFKDRYRSFPIHQYADLLECARVIEGLPVTKHKMKAAEYYAWSSYRYYAYGQKSRLITPNPFYLKFDCDVKERMKFYRHYLTLIRPYDELILKGLSQ